MFLERECRCDLPTATGDRRNPFRDPAHDQGRPSRLPGVVRNRLRTCRCERASLIVTSNKPFGRWCEVFGTTSWPSRRWPCPRDHKRRTITKRSGQNSTAALGSGFTRVDISCWARTARLRCHDSASMTVVSSTVVSRLARPGRTTQDAVGRQSPGCGRALCCLAPLVCHEGR